MALIIIYIIYTAEFRSSYRFLSGTKGGILRSFMHNIESATSFLAIPGMQSYAPHSEQIFGILGQIKEDVEQNLSEAQKSEAKSKAEYESPKAANDYEIATGRKLKVATDANIAEIQEKFTEETKQLEDTQGQLAMDVVFLKNMKEKCATMDADFDKPKDRLTEIDPVGDTFKILNHDESFEAFAKQTGNELLESKEVGGKYEFLIKKA